MIPRIVFPLCLLLGAFSRQSHAFHSVTPFGRATSSTRRQTIIPHVSNVEELPQVLSRPQQLLSRTRRIRDVALVNTNQSDPSALTFSGQIVKTSRPLVSSQSHEDRARLIDFFKSTEARNTLFVSDAPPVPIDPVSPSVFAAWQAETQRLGAARPERSEHDTQTVMQLCSNGISFSGLVVETTVLCGAKLIESCEDNHGLPAYEFTMIQDSTHARGPRLLMWIYNQVMGLVSKNSNSNKNQKTTTSICRISLVEQEDHQGLGIHFESSFQVQMKLPSFLLKVLPVSKSRAEQQGSSAVTGFVQKGVVDSLHRFEKTFYQSLSVAP